MNAATILSIALAISGIILFVMIMSGKDKKIIFGLGIIWLSAAIYACRAEILAHVKAEARTPLMGGLFVVLGGMALLGIALFLFLQLFNGKKKKNKKMGRSVNPCIRNSGERNIRNEEPRTHGGPHRGAGSV